MKQITITNTLKTNRADNGVVWQPKIKYQFSPEMDLYEASFCLKSLISCAEERLRDINLLIGRSAGRGA